MANGESQLNMDFGERGICRSSQSGEEGIDNTGLD
jgi:hypothetical protein